MNESDIHEININELEKNAINRNRNGEREERGFDFQGCFR
jgi:hypothetical protein